MYHQVIAAILILIHLQRVHRLGSLCYIAQPFPCTLPRCIPQGVFRRSFYIGTSCNKIWITILTILFQHLGDHSSHCLLPLIPGSE